MNKIKKSKTWAGVLLFFCGILGLIIGLLLYPYNTYERKTFIRGWVGALLGLIVIGLIACLFSFLLQM